MASIYHFWSCLQWSSSRFLFVKDLIPKMKCYPGLTSKWRDKGFGGGEGNCLAWQRQISWDKSLECFDVILLSLDLIKPLYLNKVQTETWSCSHGQGYDMFAKNLCRANCLFLISIIPRKWTNKLGSPMFMEAFFTTAKTGKQSKCPLTEDKDIVHMYNGVLLSC